MCCTRESFDSHSAPLAQRGFICWQWYRQGSDKVSQGITSMLWRKPVSYTIIPLIYNLNKSHINCVRPKGCIHKRFPTDLILWNAASLVNSDDPRCRDLQDSLRIWKPLPWRRIRLLYVYTTTVSFQKEEKTLRGYRQTEPLTPLMRQWEKQQRALKAWRGSKGQLRLITLTAGAFQTHLQPPHTPWPRSQTLRLALHQLPSAHARADLILWQRGDTPTRRWPSDGVSHGDGWKERLAEKCGLLFGPLLLVVQHLLPD